MLRREQSADRILVHAYMYTNTNTTIKGVLKPFIPICTHNASIMPQLLLLSYLIACSTGLYQSSLTYVFSSD